MDDFDNLSEDDIKQLMALGVIPEQMDELKQQINTAQALRDRKAPQGYDTGRVYVAASPLEHAAYAMQGIKAGRDIKNARMQQQKLLADQVRGRSNYFNHFRGDRGPIIQDMRVDSGLVPSPNFY